MVDFNAALKDAPEAKTPEVMDQLPIQTKLDPTPYKANFDRYALEINNMKAQSQLLVVDSDESAEQAVSMATQAKGLIKKIDAAHKAITGPFQKFKSAIDSFRKSYKDQLLEIPESLEPKVTVWNRKKREEAERLAEIERKKAVELQCKLDAETAEKNRIIREKAEAEARAKAEEEARIKAEQEAIEAKKRAEEEAEKARIQAEKNKKSKEEAEKAAEEAKAKAEETARIAAEEAEKDAKRQADEAAQKAAEEAKANELQAAQVAEVVADIPESIKTTSGSASAKLKWVFEITDIKNVPAEYLLVDEKKIKHLIAAGIREISGINIFQQEKTTFRSK